MLIRLKSGTIYDVSPYEASSAEIPYELAGRQIKGGKEVGPVRFFKRTAVEAILNKDGSVYGSYLLDPTGRGNHQIRLADSGPFPSGLCVSAAQVETN